MMAALVTSAALGFATAARAQVEPPPVCGNGVLEAPEECDDGNLVPGDCCSELCLDENAAPVCDGAAASVKQLWPPNHKMVPVGIVGVSDPDGDPLAVTVTAIFQDEPVDAQGDGATCPDGVGLGTDGVALRAERSGRGDGRVYHVAFEAVDRCNAACTGQVSVVVRHDRGRKKTPGDGGPIYDSTGGVAPCEGGTCDPVDCVPDPDDVDECTDDEVPSSVTAKVAKATIVLERGQGKKRGRLAARTLRKAAKRAAKAAARGDLSDDCGSALADVLRDASECIVCQAAE